MKNQYSIFFVCFALLLGFTFKGYAQDSQWIVISDNNQVELSINYDACKHPILKVVNNSAFKKKIIWKEKIINYSDEKEYQLNNGNSKSFIVEANSISKGDCSANNNALNININNYSGSIGDGISEIELMDIIVERQN